MPRVGNLRDLTWTYDPSGAAASPKLIGTPRLEVRCLILKPGQYPPCHRHHGEMDEGFLIMGGRGLMQFDGEAFEVRKGSVVLGKRGGFHSMKNVGGEDLVEFNCRGGKMPSGFVPPGDKSLPDDPELAGRRAEDPSLYVRGTVDSLTAPFDLAAASKTGLPKAIATPYLEVRLASFAPGDRPPLHRHQKELDEATLVLKGQVAYEVDGERVEGGPGDLLHVPGGAWHCLENTGGGEAQIYNVLGGELPVRTEWKR